MIEERRPAVATLDADSRSSRRGNQGVFREQDLKVGEKKGTDVAIYEGPSMRRPLPQSVTRHP